MTRHQKEKIYQAGYENLKTNLKAKNIAAIFPGLAILSTIVPSSHEILTKPSKMSVLGMTISIILCIVGLTLGIKMAMDNNRLVKEYFKAVNNGEFNIRLDIKGCDICCDNMIVTSLSLEQMADILGFNDPAGNGNNGKTKLLQFLVDETKPTKIQIQETDETLNGVKEE